MKRCVKAYAYCKDCTLNVNNNNWHDVSTIVSAATSEVVMRKATVLMKVDLIGVLRKNR